LLSYTLICNRLSAEVPKLPGAINVYTSIVGEGVDAGVADAELVEVLDGVGVRNHSRPADRALRQDAIPIHGHDLPVVTLGVFILWIGWFGINGGSTI
jgi:ammonia channel protein AmtB